MCEGMVFVRVYLLATDTSPKLYSQNIPYEGGIQMTRFSLLKSNRGSVKKSMKSDVGDRL